MDITSPTQSIFLQYCNELELLFTKSAKQKNPALWLFKNNARTTLFMLESLARMFKTMHNKKRFTKMQEKFKMLEDSIGAIDYYVSLHNYCKTNKKIPVDITNYFEEEVENTCDALNAYLAESYFEKHTNLNKIKEKIKSADWASEEFETIAIRNYFKNQIDSINEWIAKVGEMTNLEEHVHELRRKLRWLSIIPQALQGKVQLSISKTTAPSLKKYLTPEILKSPYNQMVAKGKLKSVMLLDKNYFYALSWMISEMGKTKDQGLMQEAFAIA